MNAPVLTNWGKFDFSKKDVKDAKTILSRGFISAVGHKGTADMLSSLLEMEIPTNRISIKMEIGDVAVVFKLKERLPEGVVLSKEELEKLSFEFGFLTMLE